jgi:ABC-type antimicrobial peptide transport system permease subunit
MAAAAGYIYLNDPINSQVEIGRFDIFYSIKETGGADINFFMTRKSQRRNVKEEIIQNIYVIWASKTITTIATTTTTISLKLNDGSASIDLGKGLYDANSDTLLI